MTLNRYEFRNIDNINNIYFGNKLIGNDYRKSRLYHDDSKILQIFPNNLNEINALMKLNIN